jgi:hypothetical protein
MLLGSTLTTLPSSDISLNRTVQRSQSQLIEARKKVRTICERDALLLSDAGEVDSAGLPGSSYPETNVNVSLQNANL